MTDDRNPAQTEPQQKPLSFDPADMLGVRIKPAELARVFNVSRQTVSQWVKKGVVTLGPDGLVDLARATRELMRSADKGRLRARVFKSALQEVDELRKEIEETRRKLAETVGTLETVRAERDEHQHLERLFGCMVDRLLALLEERGPDLRAADPDDYQALIDGLYEQAEAECGQEGDREPVE